MKILKIQPEKCTGCMLCAIACSLAKSGECNPHKGAIRIEKDPFKRFEIPLVCVQCEDPVCLTCCPQNAYRNENGVIIHDPDRCILCGMCAILCPNSGINFTGEELIKCDLCGGEPVCIRYCGTKAISYEEVEEHERAVRSEHVSKILDSKRVKQTSN